MALLQVEFFSYSLGRAVAMNVILPQGRKAPLPTLYLLHGLSDNHTIWTRRTSIERYADKYPLAVVMPDGGRSFYTDMDQGDKYFTFISKELPEVCETFFPLSKKREDRFAAGLSMGGYGAMKLGLALPHRYAAVASLSGSMDMGPRLLTQQPEEFQKELIRIFGSPEKFHGSVNDLFSLARKLAKHPEKAPKIYAACGTEDFLLEANRAFRDEFGKALGVTYEESPGTHEWGFWDAYIQKVLAFLPIAYAGADKP
jgi:S-formylglutathione hydrolase FrmB